MEVMLERKSSQRHSSREKRHRDLQREVNREFRDYGDVQYDYYDDRVPTYHQVATQCSFV